MLKFLKAIWNNEWTPCSLLEVVTKSNYHEYDKPNISFFGIDYGYWWDDTERTLFGRIIDSLPAIISLLFLVVYYPIMSILWFPIFIVIGILKTIISLFTKRWSDI